MNEQFKMTSPIYMVSSADLERVVRDILKEILDANNAEKDETLLTVQQAAALLNVNRTTLWHWEKQGYLRPIRIGRKVRYRLSSITTLKKEGNYGE